MKLLPSGARSKVCPAQSDWGLEHIELAKYFEDSRIVEQSGLFDDDWYMAANPDVESSGIRAFAHDCDHGWKEGRQPNFYFDPDWYCANYPEWRTAGRNPLCDYVEVGEEKGLRHRRFLIRTGTGLQHALGTGKVPCGTILPGG